MHHELHPADVIIVLGSYDTSVAERAVDLYNEGLAPYVVFSGGFGRHTEGVFEKSEAEVFADVAKSRGLPESCILIENKSANTGENIRFSKRLLLEKVLDIKKCIVVTKPYMERRAYATFKKHWAEVEVMVTSPLATCGEYLAASSIDREQVIDIIVGDTQRIKLYSDKGFQIHQDIPAEVWKAWEELVKAGYTKHLIDK